MEAAIKHFKQAGVNPVLTEKVIEEFGKLDEGSQFAEVGKIINDVADIMLENHKKEKGRE